MNTAVVSRKSSLIKNIELGFFYFLLTIITILFVIPFIYVLYTSFRTSGDILKQGILSWPTVIRPSNYITAWINGRLWFYTINSLIITLPAVFISIGLSSACGYAIARMRFKGKNILFFLILVNMYIPVAVKLIPVYQMYNVANLSNTYIGIVLLHIAGSVPFCTFVMRNFFMTVPKEMQESAIIDGCSYFGSFIRIFMPLSTPSVAVLIILQFTTIWNSFIWELLLLTKKVPIMVGIMALQGEYTIDWAIQCTGAIIASLPTLIVFFCFQRFFISGLTAGAVKG